MMTRGICVGAVAALAALMAGCGSGNSNSPEPGLSCTNLPTGTILILNNAVCPQTLTVSAGTRVNFINNDSRAHEMFSDPHPEHTNCLELNQVGHLEPGQSRETGNLNTARRCGFHDHINDANRALQGTITIQ
jgi:plastocyanin